MTLKDKGEEFAEDLTRTVRAVVGDDCPEFRSEMMGNKLLIRQAQRAGIPLRVENVRKFLLTAEYVCTLDHEGAYLRVFDSKIAFFYSPSEKERSIFFRYDFLRPHSTNVPAAHLHIHESRGFIGGGTQSEMAAALALGGDATRRGKRTQKKIDRGIDPKHQDFHYPLGGERFRPCLEDFLESIIHEFGVDAEVGWHEALANGREKWRRTQTAAVVRDAPETAAEALRRLGYRVSSPETGPRLENVERLRAL